MNKTPFPLIALVATAVFVDGKRCVIQPGQPLPDLNAADRTALLRAKAAREAAENQQAAANAGAATDTAAGAANAKTAPKKR